MAETTSQLEILDQIEAAALRELQTIQAEDALGQWRVANLGRSSPLMQTFSQLPQIPKDLRPAVGQRANQVKQALEAGLAARVEALKAASLARSLESKQLDITLPGRSRHGAAASCHADPSQVYRVFGDMGFQVYSTREVETDEYNFQLLNFPPDHPARDMQDPFFVDTGGARGQPGRAAHAYLARADPPMREFSAMNPSDPPPIRLFLPGMCYRYEQVTTRHEIQFNQVEGLAVGRQSPWAI